MKKLILLLFCAYFSVGMYAADYYVDGSVVSAGTGASWDSPFKTIAAAVSAASTNASIVIVDNIYIKQGTYNEKISLTSNVSSPLNKSDKISLWGGYATSNTGFTAVRDIVLYPTIIDGTSLTGPGLTIGRPTDTADGLIIENWNSNSATSQGTPAGLSLGDANSTVSNCIIRNNTHTNTTLKSSCAGVYLSAGTLQDCAIYNNTMIGTNATASNKLVIAGGIQTVGGTINRCKIYNNTATGAAGGIFVGKVTTSYATGDYLALSANVTISNCAIYNNGKEGVLVGLLNTDNKTVTLTNNTIVNNESKNIFIAKTGIDISPTYLIATNNIFSNNGAVENFTILSSMTYNAINMASVTGTGNIALANTNTAAGFVSP